MYLQICHIPSHPLSLLYLISAAQLLQNSNTSGTVEIDLSK